jgi:methionine-rich copper-binding protein CopC
MRPRPRLAPVLTAALLGAAALFGLAASPAAAHSELVSSTPEDGAVLSSAPGQVLLEFTEDVQATGSAVVVTDTSGQRIDDESSFAVSGTTVKTTVDDTVSSGTYLVAYRVVSVDGHVVDGTLSYLVELAGEASTTPSPSATRTATPSTSPSPTVTPTTSPAAGTDDTGSGTAWWLVALGAAAVATVAAVLVTRSRRSRG